jgi:hypothetical protein
MPPPSHQCASRHFHGKPELLDCIGMPFAPKGDQDLREPPPQDPRAVHPGMAAGTGGHQPGVVAGLSVMNI